MTEKIKRLLANLKNDEQSARRAHIVFSENDEKGTYIEEFRKNVTCDPAILFELDDFGFNRGSDFKPTAYGDNGNVTPNYLRVMSEGFDSIKEKISKNIEDFKDEGKTEYAKRMLECIDVVLEKCEVYKELARSEGNTRLYEALLEIPHKGARNFYEALVFIRLSIYFLRLSFTSHIGLGRFDQYMYPFYLKEKELGTKDSEILEMIEAFFISLNRDTDLYVGIQQGDNGQSLMLAGFDEEGNYLYNELSEMCIRASLELEIIDPKINLRVGKNTPPEIYRFATELTKKGLGFPQYCNDDVVVPGLIKLGYAPKDAYDYSVAACWEFIIPGKGAEIPNIAVMNYPLIVANTVEAELAAAESFDVLMRSVEDSIKRECDRLIELKRFARHTERPLLSIFFDGCIESLTDMWYGEAVYKNYGCHGTGIANAADALAAIKKTVFDDKTVNKEALLGALKDNFEGKDDIRNLLRAAPKMGNNDDYVDSIAARLMRTFADNMNGRDNFHGGVWRAGTGSAHEYHYSAKKCPATADGRGAFEPYSSSFSPSLDVKTEGILSVIQSFTKFDLSDIINGGPLTIEIHDTVLRNDIGIEKTAELVRAFILLGGHQLQLNAINRDILLDAMEHPERHKNLIVRVWGWSGYFTELDTPFREHILRRAGYTV